MIENQTDVLRVTRIDDKEVEITWIDEEVTDQPRKALIPIKLTPEISFILPGPDKGGQFVTMNKPGGENAAAAPAGAAGAGDDDRDETDDPVEEEVQAQPQEEKPKRVSPFGLFRR